MHWKETQVFFSFACSNHNELCSMCITAVLRQLRQRSEFWKSFVIEWFSHAQKKSSNICKGGVSKRTKSKINYHGDPWVFALQTISSAEVKKIDPKGRYSHDRLWNGNTATSFKDTEYLRLTHQYMIGTNKLGMNLWPSPLTEESIHTLKKHVQFPNFHILLVDPVSWAFTPVSSKAIFTASEQKEKTKPKANT